MTLANIAGCLLAAALSLAGCMLGNLSPQARFSDATFLVNDAARWGQFDAAVGNIAPSYRARFLSRRKEWGERISIAEAEVVHMQIDREKDKAFSVVNVTWLSDGVNVKKSVIAQTWVSERGHFNLVDEKLKSGDPTLFAGD